MYCILVVGMTGQGKSHFVKDYIKNRPCLVFDVQNEYADLEINPRAPRARSVHLKEALFVKEASARRNSVIVLEEATGFFEGRTTPEVRRLVLSKRHSGNVLLFCFHSIMSIPPRLMQFANYVKLFKTNDELNHVQQKFPSLEKYFIQARGLQIGQSLNIKLINQ